MIKEKRGESDTPLTENVIYLVLLAIIAAVILIFAQTASSSVGINEETYAKQIALMIDAAVPGTTVTMELIKAQEIAQENNYREPIIIVDYENNLITVKLREGKGKSISYYTKLPEGSIRGNLRNEIIIELPINDGDLA